jgi:putative transposase
MLEFKPMAFAPAILGGIKMIHMVRIGQAKYAHNLQPTLAEQFNLLAACALHKHLILFVCDPDLRQS